MLSGPRSRADPPRTVSAVSLRGSLRAFTQAPLTSTDWRVRAHASHTALTHLDPSHALCLLQSHTGILADKPALTTTVTPSHQFSANDRAHQPKATSPRTENDPPSFCFRQKANFICTGVYIVPQVRTHVHMHGLRLFLFLKGSLFLESTLSALVTPGVRRRSQLWPKGCRGGRRAGAVDVRERHPSAGPQASPARCGCCVPQKRQPAPPELGKPRPRVQSKEPSQRLVGCPRLVLITCASQKGAQGMSA